ncbi:MAG: Cation transporting ATPase, E1-E2 family [Candidatus Jorgensenbacteria bacterium GW2011_GWA1_48_11]|uniref:Cation transporting ATPase, E1-E2 family n=1 Tax=Candidatus Jorgensenbacteria bacterium GW2011_GWA1_48_11 TaxID=1618660 RepID=A0A0G1UCB8_9BACT|nr:MAG: Cation transporting ATPase, E1-E2 family [Candidatus Jorgensenbacteria bacterium GW2011_GWA1_48_11]KKW12282.1 MAG: Cation transporting ATPase, E1-E2 family [Candidatus Jorgensenbacteria bacterium GW2011_GWB1_49_9]
MNHNHCHHDHSAGHHEEAAGTGKIYICPMHPNVRSDKPGLCSECGMNLLPQKAGKKESHEHHGGGENGFDKHAGHNVNIFAKKFWLSLVLTVPIVLYSDLFFNLFGWTAPAFPGSAYLPFFLGSIVFFYGGWVFIGSAWRELKAKLPGMMTLIALAITTAYVWSVYEIIVGETHTLFWELATLITIMLLGHWVEMKAVQGAQGALKELSKLLPDKAEIIRDGQNVVVNLSELKTGDIVVVRPGAKIPADGVITDGRSQVNESMITGESKPVEKNVGNEVIAGTINGDGAFKAKVTKIGEGTFLAGVMRLVAEAQASKSRLQILSDRAAFYLTLVAVGVGALTLVLWLLAKATPSFALERLVAVLVIACPHALGLAIPLVASISTTLAAKNGFLVRNRLALELARKIDVVLFDKTGTLTKGEYGVEKIRVIEGSEEEILRLAASVDFHSEHFVAKAIVAKAKEKNLSLFDVKNFSRLAGKGTQGDIGNERISVGGLGMLVQPLPPPIEDEVGAEGRKGKTVIFVLKNGKLLGFFALADLIREESRAAIKTLTQMGVKTAMVTGDSEEVAKRVAGELGIDFYFARVLPDGKAKIVKELQEKKFENWKLEIENSSRRLTVAMVGDGINDAPALTQADLGIAIGAGTNVAIESAGIILVRNDPRDIAKIFELSKATYNKMVQNLFWATGYNVIAMPLAAGILASKGILLQPALAAVFMSLSTVIVAFNALLLKKVGGKLKS